MPDGLPGLRDLARARYGVVLLLLVGAFTFSLVAPAGGWARFVSGLLQGGAILTALARAHASRVMVAGALAAVAVTIGAAALATFGSRYLAGISDLAGAVLLALVPAAIVLEFRRDLAITVQSVLAALCVYVVLGMFFAILASAVATLGDRPYFAGRPSANAADYTYFSFITLATIGYGDFVPGLGVGRALAVLEGLLGQLYLVTVVGLVVGNLGRPGDRSARGDG